MNSQRLAETTAWLDILYSRCDESHGEIIWSPKSKTETKAAFPVGSSHALVQAATAMSGHPDHYCKINLMDTQAMRERARRENKGSHIVGNMSEVKTVVSFHLDCDADKSSKYGSREAMLKAVNMMPVPPTLVVNSDGAEGGFHCYWILQTPYRIADDDDRKYIADLSNRWQARLNSLVDGKLDSTGDLTRFLRVVGQPRSNGNTVSCHEFHNDRFYSLRQLTVPKSTADVTQQVKRVAGGVVRETLGPISDTGKPVSDYIDSASVTVESLLMAAGYSELKAGEWLRPGSASGARTLLLATKLDRAGINVVSAGDPNFACHKTDGSVGKFHSIDEIFVVFRHSGNWRDAASWCREQINKKLNKGVDLTMLNSRSVA